MICLFPFVIKLKSYKFHWFVRSRWLARAKWTLKKSNHFLDSTPLFLTLDGHDLLVFPGIFVICRIKHSRRHSLEGDKGNIVISAKARSYWIFLSKKAKSQPKKSEESWKQKTKNRVAVRSWPLGEGQPFWKENEVELTASWANG